MKRVWLIFPILALLVGLFTVPALGAEAVTADFTVTVTGPVESVIEIRPAGEGNLNNDKTNPMPEGTVDGVYTVEGYATGAPVNVSITFTEPGTYSYEVKQVAREGASGTYDGTVYTVNVYVSNETNEDGTETGKLLAVVALATDEELTKPAEIAFNNSHPYVIRDSEPEPEPDPTPTPDPDPDPDPDIDIGDVDTPLDGGDDEDDDDDDIDIEDPDVPLADLPQTGLLWWPVPVMLVGGAVMVFVGVKAGKKSEK